MYPVAVTSEHHLEIPRTARYYTMGSDHAREVWFVLHGYGQLARTFIEQFALIQQESRQIVAPEALNRFYLSEHVSGTHAQSPVGATWMTREDREHEIQDYVRYLDLLHSRVASKATLVRVLGFSQATATASRWAAMGSAKIDELILWGGAFAEDLDMDRYRSRLAGMRITCVLGERDQMVPREKVAEQLLKSGLEVRRLSFPGGHRLDNDTLKALAASW